MGNRSGNSEPLSSAADFMPASPVASTRTTRQRIVVHLLAIAFYLCLAILSTWPTLLNFTTQAVGEHYADRAQPIWNIWWTKTALLDLHTNPFHTNLLYFPNGAD